MKILWEGPFETQDSFAHVNRNFTKILEKQGVEVYKNELAKEADCDFHVRHLYPPLLSPSRAPLIWIQGTEIGGFPESWLKGINIAHAYWTYSHFCADQAKAAGMPSSKVEVIPMGIDPKLFSLDVEPCALPTQKKFCFLFVGGILYRKGVDLLLEAFIQEFGTHEDVALILKGSYYYDQWILKKIYECIGNDKLPEVVLIEEPIPGTDLAALYRACNCYVQPYRAEGFGWPILEAMASGLPAIIPRAGGALDFATMKNSIQIPAKAYLLSEEDRKKWDMVDVPFCYQPELELLRKAMRFVYENAKDFNNFGRRASEEVRSKHTHQNLANWMINKFQEYKKSTVERSVPKLYTTQHFVVEHNMRFEEQVKEFEVFLETFSKGLVIS